MKPPLEVPVRLSPVFGSKKGPFFISAHAGGEQTSGKQLLVSIPLHEKLNNGIVTRQHVACVVDSSGCLVDCPRQHFVGLVGSPGCLDDCPWQHFARLVGSLG